MEEVEENNVKSFLLFLSFIFLYLGLLSASFVWRFKKDPFMANEADRCLNHFCEIPKGGLHTGGRMYTRVTLAVVADENGKRRFIKQSKPCGITLLE